MDISRGGSRIRVPIGGAWPAYVAGVLLHRHVEALLSIVGHFH